MNLRPFYRAIAPAILATILLLSACGTTPPSTNSTGNNRQPITTTTSKKTTSTPPSATNNQQAETVTTTQTSSSKKTKSTKKKDAGQMLTADQTATASYTASDTTPQTVQKGSAFNKFFPKTKGTAITGVFTGEKEGFAEMKLSAKGTEIAKLSISDTANNLSARTKFQSSKTKVAGYPSAAQGKTATAILVGDRYQIKVLSRDPSFTEADRQEWLAKFDLTGLAALK